jgi:hypothetical protein
MPVTLVVWAKMTQSRSTTRGLKCAKVFNLTGINMYITVIIMIIMINMINMIKMIILIIVIIITNNTSQ